MITHFIDYRPRPPEFDLQGSFPTDQENYFIIQDWNTLKNQGYEDLLVDLDPSEGESMRMLDLESSPLRRHEYLITEKQRSCLKMRKNILSLRKRHKTQRRRKERRRADSGDRVIEVEEQSTDESVLTEDKALSNVHLFKGK